jgi:phage tail sheath gpL-like
MPISTAVGLERVSRVVGYQVKAGNFAVSTPNLPQSVVVFAEANTDKQVGLDTTKRNVTSATEAAELYGYGSPAHQIMRILRPPTGGGLGGIPTYVIAQAEAGGALAAEREITITGTPTGSGDHFLVINGRDNLDGGSYGYTVTSTDTPTTLAAKISDAINNVLSCPVTASAALGVVTLTTKFAGKTSEQFNVTVDTGDDELGMAYAVASTVTGAGTQTIANDLLKIGSEWNTIVINSYDDDTFAELEAFNGTPHAATPVGRYESTTWKPFISLWGSIESDKDNLVLLTNAAARKDQVTNVLCPAPNSSGFTWEASANGALIAAPIYQNTPHLSVNAQSYNDMPVPSDLLIGDMSSYDNRDFLVKKGCSTVDMVNGKYTFQDFVSTYAPTGDNNPSWRYARSLNQDWNMRYGYFLLEEIHVRDHAIAASDQVTSVAQTIKPKQWLQILNVYFNDMAERVIISDPDFSKESLQVGVSETNPDRLETSFSYKRSGIARIASTTAEAGFAFGVR